MCLVHSDFNAKNILVETATGEVTGLVDWEFAHAGGPFTDLGNLLRFDAVGDAAWATDEVSGLDHELLAVLAVGVPVGLGLYFAWVTRDWSARTKAAGLAVAVGGALAGVWLGFNATDGFFALATAIAGAAIGGNLILLALDIAWDRRKHDRFAADEALLARPSTG